MSTKTAKRTKAAPRTRKSTAPAGAKHANANPLPVPNLAPNAVEIPSTDALMGAQFSANVNCKTHTIQRGKRKGQPVRRCDRQRLTVVGGATPSSDHPRRKQLFAVQSGSRFTIPDREIRRDLRDSHRVRGRASCDTYRERAMQGKALPASAFDACPGLDALEPVGPVDTSFDVKGNGPSAMNGWQSSVISPAHDFMEPRASHGFTRYTKSFSVPDGVLAVTIDDFGPGGASSLIERGFHGGSPVASKDAASLEAAMRWVAGRVGHKSNGRHGGVSSPFGSHETPVELVRGHLAQWAVRPLLRDLGGGRVLVVPSRQNLAAGFDASKLMQALSYKRYRNHEFRIDPETTGRRVVVRVSAVPESQLLREMKEAQRWERAARKPNHHGGYHEPGDPLGVYMPPLDKWQSEYHARTYTQHWDHPALRWHFSITRSPRGAISYDVHDFSGRSGSNWEKHLAWGAAKTPEEAYQKLVRWYARVKFPDVYESSYAGKMRAEEIKKYGYVVTPGLAKPNRAPRGAVPGQTYADTREDDLTGRRVSGERYAGEVRGRAVGCDGKTPSHIVGGHIFPRSRVASAVRRETKEMDKQIRAAAFKSRYGTFDAPQSMAVYDADEGLARMAEIEAAPEARALVRRAFDEVYPESAPAPLQLGPGPSFGAGEIEPLRPSARAHERFRGRFGAGTAEELRPRPATTTAAVSDADLAAMFMEEAAKLGLVKQNRRFHAARYPTRRR